MGINYTTSSIATGGIQLCLDAANPLSWIPGSSTGTVSYAQTTYTTPGESGEFIVPEGVTQISAVLVGGGGAGGAADAASRPGGGGGGGALAYGTISVTPDEDLEFRVGPGGVGENDVGGDGGTTYISRSGTSLLSAGWGKGGDTGGELYPMLAEGGSSSGTDLDGGGDGGDGGSSGGMGGGWQGGAGGAGGYSGNGGNGYDGQSGTGSDGAGGGGGGGGGSGGDGPTGAGGGVGIMGESALSGEGGNNTDGSAGSGGSGQTYGGGGSGAAKDTNDNGEDGGGGAIRIVYYVPTDATRVYPTLANVEDTTYTTGASNWNDISGNRNNATPVSAPTYTSDNGGAFNFDNGSSQYVECGNVISLTAYTKSVWFRPETVGANNIISGPANSHVLYMGSANNTLKAGHQGTWDRVSYSLPSGNMLNQWWNGVVTWNNSTGWVLYLNGDQVDTDSDTTGPNNAETFISKYASGYGFDGDIAQVLIYDRVITAAEVLQNYNSLKGRFGL